MAKKHTRRSKKSAQPFLKLYREATKTLKALKRAHGPVSAHVKVLERIDKAYGAVLNPAVEGTARYELRNTTVFPVGVIKVRHGVVKDLIGDTKAVLRHLRTFDKKVARAKLVDQKAQLAAKENVKKAKALEKLAEKKAKLQEREAAKQAKKAEKVAAREALRAAKKAEKAAPGGLLVEVLVESKAKGLAELGTKAVSAEQLAIDGLLGKVLPPHRQTPEEVAKNVTAEAVASVDALNAALRGTRVLVNGQERVGKDPMPPPPPVGQVAMPPSGNGILNVSEEPDFDEEELTEAPF